MTTDGLERKVITGPKYIKLRGPTLSGGQTDRNYEDFYSPESLRRDWYDTDCDK